MDRLLPVLRRVAPWALRVGAVLLLLGGYLWCWRPARLYLARHTARPLLAAAARPSVKVTLRGEGRVMRVVEQLPERDERTAAYEAPAGVRFLFPALVLVALFPRRRYWFLLWGAHVAAAGVALLVLAVAVAGWEEGWGVYRFWVAAGHDFFSLLAPLLMWLHGREGRFLPEPPQG